MFKSAAFALITLIASTSVASAQSPLPTPAAAPMCGDRGAVVDLLKQQFGEEQEEIRLHSDQALMELFASEKGTWSILVTSPAGTSCIVAAGKGLSSLARI